jgi:flagellar hook-basal body complex protein FliE
MKKAIGLVGAAAILVCSGNAMAQPAQQRGTMSQAIESVGGNLADHPGNPGLPNAFGRLLENSDKHLQHQQEKAEKATADRTQGPDRVERTEKVDRPERVERVERPEKPERPERVVRVERPEPPGKAKK